MFATNKYAMDLPKQDHQNKSIAGNALISKNNLIIYNCTNLKSIIAMGLNLFSFYDIILKQWYSVKSLCMCLTYAEMVSDILRFPTYTAKVKLHSERRT